MASACLLESQGIIFSFLMNSSNTTLPVEPINTYPQLKENLRFGSVAASPLFTRGEKGLSSWPTYILY